MKKILFYYAYLDGNYRYIVQDQLSKILLSGLYEECDSIEVRIAGKEYSNIQWLLDILKSYAKINAEVITIDRNVYPPEFHEMKVALQQLSSMAEEQDGYYGWVHAKGVTNHGYHIDQWRLSMDHSTIWDYRKSWAMLDEGYDAVGPNVRYDTFLGYFPHFSGCYFWANSSYIKKLDPSYLTDLHNKYSGEFWVGSYHQGKLGSSFECGADAPYAIETTINKYITK